MKNYSITKINGNGNVQKVEVKDSNLNRIILIKVGNDCRPAREADIDNIREQVESALSSGQESMVLVTHHAVMIEQIYI